MMERMPFIGRQPSVGKFRDEQIAQQATWNVVPEGKRVEMRMHTIHVIPANGSTMTFVAPLDPGNQYYLDSPPCWDKVYKSR